VWAIAATTIVGAAAAFGYHPFAGGTWSRWDSAQYEGIARDGYTLYRCPLDYAPDPGGWCGNAGWFPGYPWLFGGLHLLGLPLRGSAVTISWLFAAATLVLLWNTFLARRTDFVALGALLYAAWAPGQIYDYTIFPMSVLAFFTIAHLWLLHRGRYLGAGLAGAAAVLAYPLGLVLVPVSALWLVVEGSVSLAKRLRRVAYTSGLVLAGLGVIALDQRLETGHWDAYLLVQGKYHHHLQNAIAATRDSLRPLVHGSPLELAKAPAFQTAVVTFALVAVLVYSALRRRSFDRLDALFVPWAVVTWAWPLSQADVSIQRSQAALLPLAILVRRLPRPLVIILIVAAVAVAVAMEKLFLQGKIV
jgi:hypothetical protein